MHWYAGSVGGGFQGYTISATSRRRSFMPPRSARTRRSRRCRWRGASLPRCTHGCAIHLYRHGRKFTPDELVEHATGGPMRIAPYVAYLRTKYGEIYRLP